MFEGLHLVTAFSTQPQKVPVDGMGTARAHPTASLRIGAAGTEGTGVPHIQSYHYRGAAGAHPAVSHGELGGHSPPGTASADRQVLPCCSA